MDIEKTEKQKMINEELYFADDPELLRDYWRAQDLLAKFNESPAREEGLRRQLLMELFAYFGKDAIVRSPLYCDYGYNISIGERSFINFNCVFLDCAKITIGQEVQIAPGVHIYTASHPLKATQRRSGMECARSVVIEDGVWLGGGSLVCPGVLIGENTVVGAGSVVTKSLPPNVLAVGNPCRVLRSLP